MSPALVQKLKLAILGKRYDLSVAFIAPAAMRQAMKHKRVPAQKLRTIKTSNVLSFPLSKTSGEILICKAAAKPFSVPYLFIHGALHLKGYKHGVTMDKLEDKFLNKFALSRNE